MDSLLYVLPAIGLILGFIIAYIFQSGRVRALTSQFQQEIQSERDRAIEEAERNKLLTEAVRVLEGDRGRLSAQAEERAEAIQKLEDTIKNRERTLEAAQRTNQNLSAEIERLKAELKAELENFEKLQEAREALANQFEAISQKVLAASNHSFLRLAEENLGKYQESAKGDLQKRQQAIQELVSPLQTKLQEFERKVEEVYRTEAAERNTLRGEIKNLVELNQQISKEASNLALALKGDTKKQGNWGELICEKILEFSGLRKGSEYQIQVALQDEDGRRLQPDIVVFLPDKKHIIIDSKVSLVAYDRVVGAQSEEERSLAIQEHIASVRRHIKELSDKKYPSIPDLDAPDFTLLFMPIEPSFGLALQADGDLFAYAWDRKIVIVSPSTLLATLRTISSIWKQERQTRNALEIADRAGKMYDKFVGFVDDLLTAGKKMSDAKSSYDEAMKKLSTGPGNLVRQSEQLRDLGAKATKQLSPSLVDRASEAASQPAIAAGPDTKLFE